MTVPADLDAGTGWTDLTRASEIDIGAARRRLSAADGTLTYQTWLLYLRNAWDNHVRSRTAVNANDSSSPHGMP